MNDDIKIPTDAGRRIRVEHFTDGAVYITQEYESERRLGSPVWDDNGSVHVEQEHKARLLAALAGRETVETVTDDELLEAFQFGYREAARDGAGHLESQIAGLRKVLDLGAVKP